MASLLLNRVPHYKAVYLFLLSITLPFSASAQAPGIVWQKTIGGSDSDEARDMISTYDGGYLIVGNTSSEDYDVMSNNQGGTDIWAIKLSASGDIEWEKCFGGTQRDLGWGVTQTTDSCFVFTGIAQSNDGDVTGNNGTEDYWVVKISATGDLLWQNAYGGSSYDYAYDITQANDGGFAITGLSYSNNGQVTGHHGSIGYTDYWVVKISATGVLEWQRSLGGSLSEQSYAITSTYDGGFAVVGWTTSTNGNVTGMHGGSDYWVAKLSATGVLEWQKSLGGTTQDHCQSIIETADSNLLLAGYSNSDDGDVTDDKGGMDAWLVKLSANGTILWQKVYGGSSSDWAYEVINTNNSGFAFIGHSRSDDGDLNFNHGDNDIWVVKLNDSGDIEWQSTFGGSRHDYAECLLQNTDGSYAFAGFVNSNNGDITTKYNGTSKTDIWAVKLGHTINAPILTDTVICLNDVVYISLSSIGTFDSSNVFSIELSDHTGNFTAPLVLDTLTATHLNDTIAIYLPQTITPGSGYRIRVVASAPMVISPDNGYNITIAAVVYTTVYDSICVGDSLLIGGIYQTNSGAYFDTLEANIGCDSVITTILEVLPPPYVHITQIGDTLWVNDEDVVAVQWFYNSDSIGITDSYTHLAEIDGAYYATVYNSYGCHSYTDTVFVVPLSINNYNDNSNAIICYPNPTKGAFYIQINSSSSTSWYLYNNLGKLVKEGEIQGSATINIADMPAGVYSIKVSLGKHTATQRLVKID